MEEVEVIDDIELIGSKLNYYNEFQKVKTKDEFITKLDSCMINGKWGSGKSIFIKKLQELGISKDINILIIDTWKYEYLVNPERMIMVELLKIIEVKPEKKLISFIGSELFRQLDEELTTINKNDTSKEKVFKNIYKFARSAGNNSEYSKQQQLFDELAFSYLDEGLLDYFNIDVIIFDELDRVLPETFIETIKFIKYFNDDSNKVTCSAAMNLVQCNAMIKHTYGEHFSSVVYLDKIFRNKINIENYNSEKGKYIFNEYLRINSIEHSNAPRTYAEYICHYFKYTSDYFDDNNTVGYGFEEIELREVEKLILEDLSEFNVLMNRHVQAKLDENLGQLIMSIFYVNRLSIYDNQRYMYLMQRLQEIDNNSHLNLLSEGFDIPLLLTPQLQQAIFNVMKAKHQDKFAHSLANLHEII